LPPFFFEANCREVSRTGHGPRKVKHMLFKVILAFHVLVCLTLIIVVLLQSSKGGGLAGAFGGGGGQTMFGGQETATFLSKTTTYLAVLFMVLSLTLAFLSSKQGTARPRSVIREAAERQQNVIPRGDQDIQQLLSGAADSTAGAAAIDTTAAQSQ
jgi:preprotein translocase subunit SecG